MAQSLTQLYIHIVFHVKNNDIIIKSEDENELYKYIGGIIKAMDSVPIMINGMNDHVHVLCSMSKNIGLAKLVEEIKKNSSRWIKTKGECYKNFSWQGGYGGFSVSSSKIGVVKRYIENQKEHHKKQSFKEEYIVFLHEYGVEYDEKYLWT